MNRAPASAAGTRYVVELRVLRRAEQLLPSHFDRIVDARIAVQINLEPNANRIDNDDSNTRIVRAGD
jgi:hypothetical protein